MDLAISVQPQKLARWLLAALLLLGAGRILGADEEAAARQAAQTARETAQKAGFKLEYREFSLVLPPEEERRAAAITNAAFALRTLRVLPRTDWMKPVARGAARCGLQEGTNWDELAVELRAAGPSIDAAMGVLLEDRPLHFVPQGPYLLLPHLMGLKSLGNALTARMALALRAGQMDVAWTNLSAVTALATRYDPEPTEISHLVRGVLVRQACATTWEALRTNTWTDAQLAELTARWSRVDLFRGLPDTAMLQAAQLLYLTATARAEYQTNRVVTPELPRLARLGLTEPGGAWNDLKNLVHYAASQKDYARKGSYLDEAIIVRFYQRRSEEFRQAISQTNWLRMRPLPGVTSQTFLQLTTATPSPLQSMVNNRALMLAASVRANGGGATTAIGRIAETEAWRRVLLTALAVERERLRQGHAPKSLADVPGAVADFIIGQPLHYRVEAGDSVVIYSPGLDAGDDGGEMPGTKPDNFLSGHTDLVWPRIATAKEIASQPRHHRPQVEINPRTGDLMPPVQDLPSPVAEGADDVDNPP